MKYCSHCGKEILDEAVICPGCGCAVSPAFTAASPTTNTDNLVNELADKVKINGIIWLVIAAIQIILGITVEWFLLIIGILNLISGIMDLNFSNTVLEKPVGIVAKYKPLTAPIIVLVYNVIFGGIIGIVGSVYYLAAIRNFVISNEQSFLSIENRYKPN